MSIIQDGCSHNITNKKGKFHTKFKLWDKCLSGSGNLHDCYALCFLLLKAGGGFKLLNT